MLPKDFELKKGVKVWAVIPHENENCRWGVIESVGRKYIVVDGKKFDIETHREIGSNWEWELYPSPEAYQKKLRGDHIIEGLQSLLSHSDVTPEWFGGIDKLIEACEIMEINTDYP
ncbi:MAG: hypothetical protein ACK48H_12415 [Microcystis sp.]|uniref:beta barrel domain-containing protein n=1 Tax=Microcystis sp. TaxID=1127 RepID=UPI00391A6FBB